jgi:hypothetical protein
LDDEGQINVYDMGIVIIAAKGCHPHFQHIIFASTE